MRRCFRLVLLPTAVMILLLGACGQSTPNAVPPPTVAAAATSAPTDTPAPAPSPTPRPTDTPQPTDTPKPPEPVEVEFRLLGPDPVVTRGPQGNWDGQYVNPGAILYHDGLFHMFRNGFVGWPAEVGVNYLTSVDGTAWTTVSAEPVLASADVPFADPAILALGGLVEQDGTWVLFFSTFRNQGEPAVIGRATAPDPLGPWTVDPDPILEPGGPGSWDELQVVKPAVVREDDGYVMYYTGLDARQVSMIGRATSADGVTWVKHDDPATTQAPFAESDPVLQPGERWQLNGVSSGQVVKTPDGWAMLYGARRGVFRLGLATSQDGITWGDYPGNPILENTDLPGRMSFYDSELVYHEGTYYYYLEAGQGASETNIYLLTYSGPMP